MIRSIIYICLFLFLVPMAILAQDAEPKQAEENVVLIDVLYDVRLTPEELADIYIPADISECMAQLDRLLPDSTKNKIKKLSEMDFLAYSHFGLGRWVTSAWGLRTASRLAAYFEDKNVVQPEDMTSIILTTYYRTLNKKKVKFDEQIEDYSTAYWLNKKPEKENCPDEIKNSDIYNILGFYNKDGRKASLFVAKDGEDCWIYGHDYGWTKTTEEELLKVGVEKSKSRRKLIEKIYKNK